MRLVRIGVAAVSVKVGDFAGNEARLRAVIQAAKAQGVHLLVTPELAISGYSLEDKIFWPDVARHSAEALARLAPECVGITVFLGLPVRIGPLIYNAAALVHEGRVRGYVLKRHLPTYSIFYEGRNWTAWEGGTTEIEGVPAGDLVFRLPFGSISAEICEDLWSASSPAAARVRAGAEIICNPSASPFTPRKNEERKRLIQASAANLKTVYAYANLLGCDNSRLVFDGGGLIATPGDVVAQGEILSKKYWTLTTGVVDLDDLLRARQENTTWRDDATANSGPGVTVIDASDGTFVPAPLRAFTSALPKSFYLPSMHKRGGIRDAYLDELYSALVLGLRDYFEKVGAFKRFLVALSGGRDSALCLLLAVDAAKALREGTQADEYADHVSTAYLPNSAYSSSGTLEAARALAEELKVPFQVLPIDDEAQIALEKVATLSGGHQNVAPLAKQNLQARIRGAMMLNWANSVGGLQLVTSNLSEAAVGYTTTGGDNEGGFSPINNLPKTLVSKLLAYIAERDDIQSLKKVLAIPPSAELAPDQEDEKDLMPYVVLDDLLYLYARKRLSLPDCWRVLCERHTEKSQEQLRQWTANFANRFVQNQWKRDQHPVSLKVLDLDLDPKTGFRFPVTQSIQAELDELRSARLGN